MYMLLDKTMMTHVKFDHQCQGQIILEGLVSGILMNQ